MTNVLLIHLGKAYAGPLFLNKLAVAAAGLNSQRVTVLMNKSASTKIDGQNLEIFETPTYESKLSFILNIYRIPLIAFRIRRIIKTRNIEVVISPMMSPYQDFGLPLWKSRSIKYVAILHDASIHPGDEKLIQSLATKLELKFSDKIIVLSNTVMKQLPVEIQSKAELLWHPPLLETVELDDSLPLTRSGPVKFLFFGRLVKYKGIEVLMQAAEILKSEGLVFELSIVGSGPMESLRAIYQSSFVTWDIGYVEQDEISSKIRASDWMVLPYQEASQSGVVALCADLSVPMIVSDVAGLREQVISTGGAVIAAGKDAVALADKMRQAVLDPSLASLVRETYETKEERSWLAFYSEVLERLDI